MTAARALVVAALLVATSAFTASRTTPPPKPAALDALPFAIGGWRGTAAPPLDAATRRELAADAYVTRTYTAAGAPPVGLYVAYYAQQRPNVSIHSPLHCLPGTGWEPLDVSTVDLTATGAPVAARRMLVRKNLDRAVVYYWYVIHGRVVANEIASKWYLLRDSLFAGRSDAALVRVSVPVLASVDAADREAATFARALLPHATF
ncbi:MAG TPA: EpsI family protein [Vicinamibacterales bacterium]|nr:EpsI family protein [Vicinamibacterales bacterium]